ncbi:ABC transporter ATP-binding protein [Myxococcota bacterium]|nr:ABC transporter ATP-binding protein [Myxococcota bacterium]
MTFSTAGQRNRFIRAGEPAEYIVELRELTKSFPLRRGWLETLRKPFEVEKTTVTERLSFGVRDGEFFGLLGVNGAGKTTVFKMLSTLVLPDHGSLSVAGFDVAKNPAEVRGLLTPVIVDDRSLHWRLSARENLRLFAGLQGIRGPGARSRVQEVLEVVGLENTGEQLAGRFSSGMKQRLLIGRALLGRPRILLLDEPTRSLDPISARGFRQFLRDEIAGQQGCTVLLATHSAEEALELCDRVAVLHHGRLLALDTVQKLSEKIGDERYRIRVSKEARKILETWAGTGAIRSLRSLKNGDPCWNEFEMHLPGGTERGAEIVTQLVGAGHSVASFQRIELSLADLLDGVLAENPHV